MAGPLYEGWGIETLAVRQVWQRELPAIPGVPPAAAICPGPGNRIHVTGSAGTAVFEQDGTLAWQATNCGSGIVADTRGATTIAGRSGTVQFDAGGQVLWSDPGPALRIELGAEERPVVLTAGFLNAFNPSGGRVWLRELPDLNGSPVVGVTMSVASGGNPVVVGTCVYPQGNRGSMVARYDPLGNLEWVSTPDDFSGAGETESASPSAVMVASAEDIFVAGQVSRPSGSEAYLMKLDAGGRRLWRRMLPPTSEPRIAPYAPGSVWLTAGEGLIECSSDSGLTGWPVPVHWGNLSGGLPLALVTDIWKNCYFAGAERCVAQIDASGRLRWVDRPANFFASGPASAAAICLGSDDRITGAWPDPQFGMVISSVQQTNVSGLPGFVLEPSPDLLHLAVSNELYGAVSNEVTYTVLGSGSEPLRYMWLVGGMPIGETNATFHPPLSPVPGSVSWAALVWNEVGYVVSRPVTLDFGFPPRGELNTPLCVGWVLTQRYPRLPDSAFSTVLGATQILLAPGAYYPIRAQDWGTATFQWLFNDTPLPAATNHYLTLSNLNEDQGGTYRLEIQNLYGSHLAEAPVRVRRSVRQEFVQSLSGQESHDASLVSRRLVTDAQGNYFVQSGALAPTGLRWDWVLTKYHPFGFALWAVHVAELDRAYHHDIAATPQGHLLAVSSEIGTNGVRDCVTRRLGSDGSLLWETRDSGTNGANCEPWELRTDPLGNSYVLVTVHGDPNESQALVKRDPAGHSVYTWPCGPANTETRELLAVDGQGRAAVATWGGLAKLGPTGEVLWQTNRWCYCVKTDAQGFVYTYEHWPAYAIVKRDPAGQVLWSAPVYGYIEPDRSGNLYAWGLSYPQYQVSRLDGATGRVLWGRRGLDQTGDPPRQVAVDAADNLYLLATQRLGVSDPKVDISWLCKIDPQGNLLWSATYGLDSTNGFESAQLCLGAAGDVFVMGESGPRNPPAGSDFEDWSVVKYSQVDDDSMPVITNGPVDQVGIAGETATFTVSAAGAPELTYQWWLAVGWDAAWFTLPPMGTLIEGATNATLSIPVNTTNAGQYYFVEVANPFGVVSSRSATLSLESPPWLRAEAVAGGQYRFELYGQPDRTYEIQQSFDLQGWLHFTNLVTTNYWIQLTNSVDPASPALFFRAVRHPG